MNVERHRRVLPFYQDLLGFRLSDYTLRPFKAYFFHLNPRHHSFAMIETGHNSVHHVMVELFMLDDVGQAYDLALGEEGRIATTLGRHSNDFMTSFYARTPSGFFVEYGWGGRSIDPATHAPVEMTCGPSLWGHDRDWLTPERRAEARDAAAAGGGRRAARAGAGDGRQLHARARHVPWWDARPETQMTAVHGTATGQMSDSRRLRGHDDVRQTWGHMRRSRDQDRRRHRSREGGAAADQPVRPVCRVSHPGRLRRAGRWATWRRRIIQEWGIPRSALGNILAAGNFGVLLGSLVFTMVADKIGRRPVLIGATVYFSLLTLLTASRHVGGADDYRALHRRDRPRLHHSERDGAHRRVQPEAGCASRSWRCISVGFTAGGALAVSWPPG